MTRLSNRQFPMLQTFIRIGVGHMSIEQAQKFDQRPFRSMLIQGWIEYSRKGKGFRITAKGYAAWEEFRHTDIARKNASLPLTSYFDPDVYGLRNVYRKKPQAAPEPSSKEEAA